jgi:phage terminase small subunit
MKYSASIMRQRFVEEYVADLKPNAKEAAIRAGYSPRTAKQIGHVLLKDPWVKAAISAALKAQIKRIRMSADDVLVGLAEIASVDPAELYDEDGLLLPIRNMPAHVRRTISGVEHTVLGTKKIKFWDKKGALDTLAKHHKLVTDKFELTGADGAPLNATPMFQIVFESPKEKP